MGLTGFKAVDQSERGVVRRFGKVRDGEKGVRDPGLRWILPLFDSMDKISMQVRTLPIESQEIITRDNVSIQLAAAAFWKVVDPVKSIVDIQDPKSAVYQIAQTTIRDVIGRSTLDEVLTETESLDQAIRDRLDHATEAWGVKVDSVQLKDIQLPDSMKRSMAQAAEAERNKQARIIDAEGEALAAEKLAEAARVMQEYPATYGLRALETMKTIAANNNSVILFPAPISDSLQGIADAMRANYAAPMVAQPPADAQKDAAKKANGATPNLTAMPATDSAQPPATEGPDGGQGLA